MANTQKLSTEERLALLIRRLVSVGAGDIKHLYRGSCPDQVEGGNVRDCECPACRILIDAEVFADGVLG